MGAPAESNLRHTACETVITIDLTLLSCEPVDSEEAWSLSDHCPVVADFDVNTHRVRNEPLPVA
jgi:hypothetical protein